MTNRRDFLRTTAALGAGLATAGRATAEGARGGKAATPKTSLDYKTALQELIQSNGDASPRYELLSTDGPPHERTFSVRVTWSGGTAEGEGSSIKSAEMMAAAEALKMLKAVKKAKPDE